MSGWVKVPDNWFEDEVVDHMSADAILFHLSALADCARNLRDGWVPKRAVRRFRPVEDVAATVLELVAAEWWEPTPDGWYIRDWHTFILAASEVEHRRALSRETSERYRRHKAGDHSMCDRCSAVRDKSRDASVTSPEPNRTDPKGRGGESGADAGSPGGSHAPAAEMRVLPPPHLQTGDCCNLPDIHPVHAEAS